MTYRELLEDAAEAANLAPLSWEENRGWLCETKDGSPRYYWNPITDYGDALRLAVCLRLKIELKTNHVYVIDDESGLVIAEDYIDDPHAATRRAIVRAAAEIGRQKKSPGHPRLNGYTPDQEKPSELGT